MLTMLTMNGQIGIPVVEPAVSLGRSSSCCGGNLGIVMPVATASLDGGLAGSIVAPSLSTPLGLAASEKSALRWNSFIGSLILGGLTGGVSAMTAYWLSPKKKGRGRVALWTGAAGLLSTVVISKTALEIVLSTQA